MSIEAPDSNPVESGTLDSTTDAETPSIQDQEEDTGPANLTDSQASSLETDADSMDSASSTEVNSEDQEPEKITDPKLMDRYECRACGYIYEPVKGDDSTGIDAGTPFAEIYDSWKCPVCTAPKRRFSNVGPLGNPSGFKENLGYGFGVNVMTPGQKSILIFGSLFIGFLLFLSLYGLN